VLSVDILEEWVDFEIWRVRVPDVCLFALRVDVSWDSFGMLCLEDFWSIYLGGNGNHSYIVSNRDVKSSQISPSSEWSGSLTTTDV